MSISRLVSSSASSPASVRRHAWCRIFGATVEERRQAIGRSVEEAAALAGMDSAECVAIESGYVPADPARLRSMAAALEVRFDQRALLVCLCQAAWEV